VANFEEGSGGASTVLGVPKKKEPASEFGARLIALRKARGLTQAQLAEAIGSSQRMVSYYESTTGNLPAPVLAKIAAILDVSTDELLGISPVRSKSAKEMDSPELRRLWKKFQKLQQLPVKDQRAVIRLLNSLVSARR
jgi:transcriptional regulator with XRE-family HTH domain